MPSRGEDEGEGSAEYLDEIGRRRKAPYLAAFGLPSFLPLIDPAAGPFADFASRNTEGGVFVSTSYNDNAPLPKEVVTVPAAAVGGAVLSRVSWSAIFAGIVLVLAVEVLLNVLGAGVGLDLVNPGSSGTPSAASFGMGAGIWWLVSSIVALVFGCHVAARLAAVASRWDGSPCSRPSGRCA